MSIFPMTIAIAKIDGKFRIWRSTRFDGTVFIEEGKLTSREGAPSAAFTVCNYPSL